MHIVGLSGLRLLNSHGPLLKRWFNVESVLLLVGRGQMTLVLLYKNITYIRQNDSNHCFI